MKTSLGCVVEEPKPVAAVMNNVLYLVRGEKSKRRLLQSVRDVLPKGATFVLNDPCAIVGNKWGMKKFLMKLAADVGEQNIVTEHDLAIFAEMNRRFLSKTIFDDVEKVIMLAEEVGFQLLKRDRSYYGYCNFLVFEAC